MTDEEPDPRLAWPDFDAAKVPDDADYKRFGDVSDVSFSIEDARNAIETDHFEFEESISFDIGEAYVERLEKELIGAWRAGYRYLYVCRRRRGTAFDPEDPFLVSFGSFIPDNSEQPPVDPREFVVEQYDLSELNRWDVGGLR
jgi:hypothetical protein